MAENYQVLATPHARHSHVQLLTRIGSRANFLLAMLNHLQPSTLLTSTPRPKPQAPVAVA